MKIKKLQLKNFKRFDDLTINFGDNPRKIIALVGPNGCGKSSIFDAFEEVQKQYKSANRSPSSTYFGKQQYSISSETKPTDYNRNDSIKIDSTISPFDKKSFYIRSSYRFTSRLDVQHIRALPDPIDDHGRPASSADIDHRLQENYERLLGRAWKEFQYGEKSGPEMREELLGRINKILSSIVDIKISNLGDVQQPGKGQLFFEKEKSKDFPYENLSSGEKEVVDIIIDLVVKTPEFNSTVYCIDEPELHLNTAIQRRLLIEIEKLIPDTCQLWVATHSIGFLRALQEDLKEKCSIIDFSERDYFNSTCTIEPMPMTRKNWQRIFQTALEDLTGLLAPKRIIYCEGTPEPGANNEEQGLDADIYNDIFSENHHDVLFVSSGGCKEIEKRGSLALKILNKAFVDVELYLLRDRDENTDQKRESYLALDKNNRMLRRRDIENYLFDKEILNIFCLQESKKFDETKYNLKVTDIDQQDLKPVQQYIQMCCGVSGKVQDFKRGLAKAVLSNTTVFKLLNEEIF